MAAPTIGTIGAAGYPGFSVLEGVPTGAVDGNVYILGIQSRDNANTAHTLTANGTGWTKFFDQHHVDASSKDLHLSLWWKVRSGTLTAPTVNSALDGGSLAYIFYVHGANTTTPIEVVGTVANTDPAIANYVITGVTTGNAAELVFCVGLAGARAPSLRPRGRVLPSSTTTSATATATTAAARSPTPPSRRLGPLGPRPSIAPSAHPPIRRWASCSRCKRPRARPPPPCFAAPAPLPRRSRRRDAARAPPQASPPPRFAARRPLPAAPRPRAARRLWPFAAEPSRCGRAPRRRRDTPLRCAARALRRAASRPHAARAPPSPRPSSPRGALRPRLRTRPSCRRRASSRPAPPATRSTSIRAFPPGPPAAISAS